ncbi:glycine--tRNA ligase [Aquisphaera insulae]|uniref:glycine--tRNA ligase n=1 Tax=Aquisphaera insulae TaxID=2712864 RepID=UPI0020300EAE|nr:glycine--tRNA ligase [Aquisphaera insulae]
MDVGMDKLVSLCKRRGIIFPSSEIYGGINGFWDYGPLGVELKRNIKEAWWRDNVQMRDDMVGLDCSIIMNPRVWEASGHVGGFSDPMVDCRATKERYRADQLYVFAYLFPAVNQKGEPTEAWLAGLGSSPEEAAEGPEKKAGKLARKFGKPTDAPTVIPFMQVAEADRIKVIGPSTDEAGTLTEPRSFNLMFKTFVGALESDSNVAYLRPETAQGIFANFKNVVDTGRVKLPFGIAQVGKSFRNEINPRNFTFRSREFEQMEIEFFCRPDEAKEWYAYWRKARFQWYVDLGLRSDRLRLRDHDAEELAFYSTATADIEYSFPFGVSELEGIAHRGDYDLTQHQKFSGKDLSYFDEEKKERFVPHVIEPSAGADRATLAFLCEAYTEDQVGGEARTVLKFHPRIAPVKAAIFPLVKRDGMPEKARAIHDDLRRQFSVFYDEKGAIGRRYRRQDEAGTPYCITVDSQSLTDDTVTLRDRDSCRQWRVPAAGITAAIRDLLDGKAIPAGDPAPPAGEAGEQAG